MPYVGGNYGNTSNAGPSYLNLNNDRGNSNANIGFFSAYPLSQTGTFKDVSQCKKGKGIYFRSGGKPEELKLSSIQLVTVQTGEGCNGRHFAPMPKAWAHYKKERIEEMKTFDVKHSDIVSFENLLEADKNASQNKRYRGENLIFSAHREEKLITLVNKLTYFPKDGKPENPLESSYRVGKYRLKKIYEPKPRIIMALEYPDRVVQWAFYQKLNPLFDRQFITHSYGCREGKGTVAAREQLQKWIRLANRSPKNWHVLKLDIAKYFYRVDHDVLMKILSKHISDELILRDLNKLINCEDTAFGLPAGVQPELCKQEDWLYNRGMPIGNLTSQMFANIYLNELDQFCKHELHIKYYIRYMDDIIILWPDKKELHGIKDEIERFLNEELHLELNKKTSIRPAFLPVTFVGAIITGSKIRLRRSTRKRMFRRIKYIKKIFEAGLIAWEKVNNTMQSYFGLIQHFTADNLLRKIIDEFSFKIFNNS